MSLLVKSNPNEPMPPDAVRITINEALGYESKIIDGWGNKWEVWALRSGTGILGASAVVSSFSLNHHFRTKLKLGKYGRFSTYLPIVVIPAMMATLFNKTLVQGNILLRNYKCPVCLQTRAAIIQCGFGVFYPLLLAPLASFMFATRHFTYRLPSLTEQPKEVFKLWLKFTRSGSTYGTAFIAVNMFLAFFITQRQMTEHYNINLQLTEFERNLYNDQIEKSDF